MEFKSKRKYTKFFMLALALHLIVLCFYLFFPAKFLESAKAKDTISLLALVNCELILIFYLGLFRKKYFAYYDKLTIKRSFIKNFSINYSSITEIKEKKHDSIFLVFGTRPSFKIYYTTPKGKLKKVIIRSDNNELLLKVIKNEIDISKIDNTNTKKLTK